MKVVPLPEVAEINPRGDRPANDETISFVGMAQLDADSAEARPLESRQFSDVSKGYTVFRNGDLLAAKITPCWENGKIGQAILHHPNGLGSTEFHVIRPGNNVDHRYLLHFLRQSRICSDGERRMTGSGGQRRVPTAFFSGLQIPLPHIDEQRRLAAILDHADTLRTKRRQILSHLNSLITVVFNDMFGSAEATDVVPFGEVAELVGGRNLVADDATAESPYRVLKISAVTSGTFNPAESKPLPDDYVPPSTHLVRDGDLLMSRANTAELVGAVAHVHSVPPNMTLPDKVWRFEFADPIGSSPEFYHALFRSPRIRRALQQMASGTGGSMKNISKQKLRQLQIPRVDSAEQFAFAQRAQAIATQRRLHIDALRQQDDLFASLQARAFQGEL